MRSGPISPRLIGPRWTQIRPSSLVLPLAAFSIALTLAIKCGWSMGRLPWSDEVVTLDLANSASYRQMFDAVYRGLDATPPLYTTIGRGLVRVVPGPVGNLVAMRVFNLALVLTALGCLYATVRQMASRETSALTLALFVLASSSLLQTLVLEIRTYALVFCSVTLSLLFSSLYLVGKRPSTLLAVTLSFVILIASHTLAIIFVAAIDVALVFTLFLGASLKRAATALLALLPAVVLLAAWVPVIRHQSGLGNWIDPPDWHALLGAFGVYAPDGRVDRLIVFGPPAVLASVVIARWLAPAWSHPRHDPVSSDRARDLVCFATAAAVLFIIGTLVLWTFSRMVTPIFVRRYLYPDALVHVPWLCMAAILILRAMPDLLRAMPGRLLATSLDVRKAAVAVASVFVCAKLATDAPPFHDIRCFDAKSGRFIESDIGQGVFVTSSSEAYLPRHWSGRPISIVRSDDPAAAAGSPFRIYRENFLSNFERWRPVDTIVPLQSFLASNRSFYILEDRFEDWPRIGEQPGVTRQLVLETPHCKLWRASVAR